MAPPAILFQDHFTSVAAWAAAGTWSITSSTWASGVGDSSGNTHLFKTMPTGCTFVEVLYYGGATSGDNWGALKLRNANGASFNSDGLGVLYRSDTNSGSAPYGMQMFTAGSPTNTFFGVNSSGTTFDYPLPGVHNSQSTWPNAVANAIRIGIWSPNTTDLYVYVNRILVAKSIGNTAASGTGVQISAYNSNNSNYDYCVLADAPINYYDYGPGPNPGSNLAAVVL